MKKPGFWARTIVSVAACLLLLGWINWDEFSDTVKEANGYWLFTVFLLLHMDRLFMAYKWRILLRTSGVSVSTMTTVKAYYIGSFWSFFLPSVGGDVVRISWLIRKAKGQSSAIIASSAVIERLLGALALAIVASGSFILSTVYFGLRLPALSRIIFLFLVVSIVAIAVIFSRSAHAMSQKLLSRLTFEKVSHMLEKMMSATLAFKEKPGLLITFIILSILEQAFSIIAIFTMTKALSIDIPIVWVIIGVPIILAVSKMPISVNGLGVQEGAYAFIFAFAGLSLSKSVAMSVTDRVLTLLATLPGALWTVKVPKS